MPYKDKDTQRAAVRAWKQANPERTKAYRKEQIARGTTIGDPLPSAATPLAIKVPKEGLKIMVLPDGQNAPGRPDEHWAWAGKYAAAKRPDVIVNIGDFWDMMALSTHDKAGSKSKEGARYTADVDAGLRAMDKFLTPIVKANGYDPYMEFFMGNHEHRITRTVEDNPVFEGAISLDDLKLEPCGWRVHPFLQPRTIGGVAFCHYFPNGVMGRPVAKPETLLARLHMSAFAGHLQGKQVAHSRRADGKEMTAIISGSFYQHHEPYLSPLTNIHWRGLWMLHEVRDGEFDEMPVSMSFLRRRFG